MKTLTLLLVLGLAAATARAQTVPFDATAPMRGGALNQTSVPPLNPGLNQSTIQGPSQVQRTTSSYDAMPSRLPEGRVPLAATPDMSPSAVPDVREQPLIPQARRRQSSDIVPDRGVSSSNIMQRRAPIPDKTPTPVRP